MKDSFFSSRNQLDEQMGEMPSVVAEQFIEASARRMVKLNGPLETARRLQRLADICAGAHVLPIEHWKGLGASSTPVEEPAPILPKSEPEKPKSFIERNSTFLAYAVGIAVGFLMGVTLK